MTLKSAQKTLAVLTLFIAVALAVPAGQRSGESGSNEEEQPSAVLSRLQERARERYRRARKRRMEQLRGVLEVESDQAWAELQPPVSRLFQLRRLRSMLQGGGYLALTGLREEPLSAPGLEPEAVADHVQVWSPQVDRKLVLRLVRAYAALHEALRAEQAEEARLEGALNEHRAAMEELESRISAAAAELRERADLRRRAGLILMGVLP